MSLTRWKISHGSCCIYIK